MLSKLIYTMMLMGGLFQINHESGEAVIKKMHDRYKDKWYKTFTFNQTTLIYKNDSLVKKQTWYEAVQFPDKFRIDFGPKDSGNAVIFKGDSAYRFKMGMLKSSFKDANDLTFLLGGMYFYSFNTVLDKLKEMGYDLSKAHEDVWKGKQVYVVGAEKGDMNANQLWIDKEKMIVVRMLNTNKRGREEAIFENHMKAGGGWSETKCTFYFDGKLGQVELYHDCKYNVKVDERIFEPREFGKVFYY
ncbi:MAG: hypothetical protein ACJ748_06550 [Flavisolibacter sp.]